MPMRRGTLYVGDNNGGSGGAQVTFPRAVSPAIPSSVTSGHFAINASSKPFPTALQGISDGERKEKSIGNFFRPTKWFSNRSASSPKLSTTSEPRASTSSGGIRARVESNARKNDPNSRKHKISRPTDPRPILDGYTAGIGSRSVLEFDMSTPNREWETRPSGSLDLQQRSSPSTPNQSTYPPSRNNALGDLRAIARRGWSKSADDLSKFPKTDAPAWPNQNERRGALAAKLAPIATNPTALQSRIEEYRAAGPDSPNVDSPVSPNLSPRPGTASPRPALVRAPSPRKFSRDDQDIHPFPTTEGVKVPFLSSSPKVPAGPMPSSLSTPLIHEETMSNPSPLTHVIARVTSSPGPTTLSFSPSPSPNLPTPPTGSPPPDMSDHGSVPLTPINGNIPSAQETPQRSTSALPPSGPPQTHSRSHSFTPRLSSKLGRTLPPSPSQPLPQAHAASPASAQPQMIYTMASPTRAAPVMQNLHAPGIGLPIPKRKGSGSSEHSIKEALGGLLSPRKSNTQLGAAAGSTGSNFSTSGSRTSINLLSGKIGRGGNSGNIAPAHQQRLGAVNKLAPPRIIEPDVDGSSESGRRSPAEARGGRPSRVDERRAPDADQRRDSLPVGTRLSVEGNSKRTSQIVYNSGFINHLTHSLLSTPHAHVNLSRGWKPYKMVLTGTKLYFWKPPSGDIQAIRALFPTTILPPEDTVEADSNVVSDGRTAVAAGARRRRAYWGRRMHPDTERDAAGKITRGTFEALVHECVFATTFFEVDDPTSPEQNWEAMAKYASYALAILLTLPPLAGRAKFENEFERCAEYLVSGAASRANNESAKAETPEASSRADDGQDGNNVENSVDVATVTEEPPDERSLMKSRVAWLASEYIRFHGEPKDLKSWDDWKAGTIPEFSFGMLSVLGSTSETQGSSEDEEQGGTLPTSSSTQAIYVRSPAGSPFLGFGTPKSNPYAAFRLVSPQLSAMTSPNVGMFSPRPGDHPTSSFMEMIGSDSPGKPSPAKSAPTGMARAGVGLGTSVSVPGGRVQSCSGDLSSMRMDDQAWALVNSGIEQALLSRDALFAISPPLFARSLTAFHRTVLQANVPNGLDAAFVISNPNELHLDGESVASAAELFGCDDHPHWLTKLVLVQILTDTPPDASRSSQSTLSPRTSSARPSTSVPPQRRSSTSDAALRHASHTHSRSAVIERWAHIAELCRLAGDACSWSAIREALLSRPVARLEKAWKRVDSEQLRKVEGWVYDPELGQVNEPAVTPWGGDARMRVREQLSKSRDLDSELFTTSHLEEVLRIFETLRASFDLCPRKVVNDGNADCVEEDTQKLVACWRTLASEGAGKGSVASKFVRVEQFMALSIATEPRRRGLFEPYYWSRPATSYPRASLEALMFPEPLPTVALIDRSQLARGRLDSDPGNMPSIHFLGGFDGHLNPEDRRKIKSISNNPLSRLNEGGTVIPVYNGELLLVVVSQSGTDSVASSRPSSRPPSSAIDHNVTPSTDKGVGRTPSIRVKPGSSAGLDRKTSIARRSSLPSSLSGSRRDYVITEVTSDRPLRVLVKAGTLDRLVELLICGLKHVSVSVADDNGEMSLKEGMTRELLVDRNEFAKVWWNVFRTFVTPIVFFELLRKEYVKTQPRSYSSQTGLREYISLVDKRHKVLETMSEWICCGGGGQDIIDDSQLYHAVDGFLISSVDHTINDLDVALEGGVDAAELSQGYTSLLEMKQSLITTFRRQTSRPAPCRTHAPLHRPQLTARSSSRYTAGRNLPDIDDMEPDELVEMIDAMASATFSYVSEEDLYVTADLLEVQTADPMGWYPSNETANNEESVDIQSMYSMMHDADVSSMISELNDGPFYKLLPPGVRSCIRSYIVLRRWIISKIVAPRLGLRTRQSRIEMLLRAIEVARVRNMGHGDRALLAEKPCVRSFAEAVITSAVIGYESRLHFRAWNNVALSRGTLCDSLVSLLSRPCQQTAVSRASLTVDMGWLLERMVEIISTPDVIESEQDGQNLINFDKRRHLRSLISNTPSLFIPNRNSQRDEITRRSFERLSMIEQEVMHIQFDGRGIRDEATREGSVPAPSVNGPVRKLIRPFRQLVLSQLEKNRRDKSLRMRLHKEKLQEQSRNERREDLLNRAMRPKKRQSQASQQKHHRNKKSMSALFHFMRPISSAFGSESIQAQKTAAELDFPPSGKPSLVVNLMDARVAQFINNERSFTFQLNTEDGGHYLLQAMTKKDMLKWIDTISRITHMAAKRRLTYIGNSPKLQLTDIPTNVAEPSRDPRAVFGVELEFLLAREAADTEVQSATLPSILRECLAEIESRGMTEVGIYRIAGAASEINALKDAFNRGEHPLTESTDIHAVCDIVKSWFRLLPEPIFPTSEYHRVIQTAHYDNLDDRLAALREVVHSLPQANFEIVRRMAEHLDKVADLEEHNNMTPDGLAIVFSPNLLRPPHNDFMVAMNNIAFSAKVVKALITHYHTIFDEADPDAELDADQEDDDPDEMALEDLTEEESDDPDLQM